MTNPTIFNTVWNAAKQADKYHANRTVQSIFNHAQSEMGEISIEINIEAGQSYKEPGPDGIMGGTLDAIASLLDIIYKINPNITEAELVQRLQPKMDKWIEKLEEHQKK